MSQAGLKIAILYDTWEDDAEEPAAPAEEKPAKPAKPAKPRRAFWLQPRARFPN